mgnify:CR=1 FL=1
MDDLERLKIKNAELQRKLEARRFDTFSHCLSLVNIIAITTQKWDIWLFYFLMAEAAGLFIWMIWSAFWESRNS